MDAILSFLKGFGSAIIGLIDFLVGFISDIVYLVQVTGRALAQIPTYLSWMPPQVSALLIAIITIAVIYKITGREG